MLKYAVAIAVFVVLSALRRAHIWDTKVRRASPSHETGHSGGHRNPRRRLDFALPTAAHTECRYRTALAARGSRRRLMTAPCGSPLCASRKSSAFSRVKCRCFRWERLHRIAADADGSAWFTEGPGKIGHIFANGRVEHYRVPAAQSTAGIAVRDHLLAASDGTRGEVTELRDGHVVARISLGPQSKPTSVAFMNDGTLTVLELGTKQVAFIRDGKLVRTRPVVIGSIPAMPSIAVNGSDVWTAYGKDITQLRSDGTSTQFRARDDVRGIAAYGSVTLVVEGYETVGSIKQGVLTESKNSDEWARTLSNCRSDLLPRS